MTATLPRNFEHWMLREIYQQPEAIAATLHHYVDGAMFRPLINDQARRWLERAEGEIVIAASGSSRHAGLFAELLFEDLSGIRVDVEYASEYSYRSDRSIEPSSLLVISQSGETADTLAALRKAGNLGLETLAVTNVPTSTMSREATVSYPTFAGREFAIPATKSFSTQILVLHLLALLGAEVRGTLSSSEIREYLRDLEAIPSIIQQQLPRWETEVSAVAASYRTANSFLFLGRDLHYPIAREGALKLKESSYLHAEGYPSGELKHGPNALVSEGIPLVMIATADRGHSESMQRYDKVLQLLRDMRAQGARVLCVGNEGDRDVDDLADQMITVPAAKETSLPLVEVVPLQMLSYFMAVQAGIDVDKPRNLVKAVVAE